MQFQWLVLQEGSLPLRPSGLVARLAEHRCTSALLWPAGAAPAAANTVVTDPCFSRAGARAARDALARLGLTFADLGTAFETHPHLDHAAYLPLAFSRLDPRALDPAAPPAGLEAVRCPGHDPDLHALVFRSDADEQVWAVGDAILDLEWLEAWGYYWPNGYGPEDVVETWRSVAAILSRADIVVPGHGAPFRVTRSLLGGLIESFREAECAAECPGVVPALERRRDGLAR